MSKMSILNRQQIKPTETGSNVDQRKNHVYVPMYQASFSRNVNYQFRSRIKAQGKCRIIKIQDIASSAVSIPIMS
jgi:hypothetical protein